MRASGRTGPAPSASASSKVTPAPAAASAVVGAVGLGLLCPADFRVSASAAGVCKEVANFAAQPCVRDLFRNMSLKAMF